MDIRCRRLACKSFPQPLEGHTAVSAKPGKKSIKDICFDVLVTEIVATFTSLYLICTGDLACKSCATVPLKFTFGDPAVHVK